MICAHQKVKNMKTILLCLLPVMLILTHNTLAQPIGYPHIRWQFDSGAPIRGTVTVNEGRLYFGNSAGTIFCIEKKSGKEIWKHQAGGAMVSQPLVAGGLVVFQTRDNKISALQAGSGKPSWTYEFNRPSPHTWGWDYYDASPVLAGSQVLVGTGDNHLYALSLTDGRLLWKFATGDKIRATPLVNDGKVYLPSFDGFLYVLDAANGKEDAKFETEGVQHYTTVYGWDRTSLISSPALGGSDLVFGSRDGGLYCINAKTLERKWRFTYGASWVGSSPAIDGYRAYVGWSDALVISAVDINTGEEVWKYNGGSYFYSTPAVDAAHVYIGSFNGKVYAFDKQTGEVRWEYQTGGSVLSSPVLDDGLLYIGSDNGILYAFGDGGEVRLAVYHPDINAQKELLSSDKISPYLTGLGYERLDTTSLVSFMKQRIGDRKKSAIVFAHLYLPKEVAGNNPLGSLLHQYMQAGGRVIWPGYFPNYWVTNKDLRVVGVNKEYPGELLELDFDINMDFGMYYSKPTDAGLNWGLPESFESVGSSVSGGKGIVPLAYNELGRVASFWKPIGANGGGCVVYSAWHYMPATESDLLTLRRLAEYGQ